MPRAGWRKNPETGIMEGPLADGRFSWELDGQPATIASDSSVMSSEPVERESEDSGEFSLDSPTGFTVRPLTAEQDRTARLSFPLTADGKIDFQKTSQKNIGKLRAAVQDSEAKAQLGLLARQLFQPHQLEWLLSFVGKLEALAVSSASKGKIEQDIANDAFTYSAQELKELAKPATAIANKHVSKLMVISENFEEFQLASTLVMFTLAKYRLCVSMQAERTAQRTRPNGSSMPVQNRSIV